MTGNGEFQQITMLENSSADHFLRTNRAHFRSVGRTARMRLGYPKSLMLPAGWKIYARWFKQQSDRLILRRDEIDPCRSRSCGR